VRTPLLVPSFSSRGFGRVRNEPVESEVSQHLDYFLDQLSTVLVSAYDLHHGLLAAGKRVEEDWATSSLEQPDVVVLDSGGYETASGTDEGELIRDLRVTRDWEPPHWQQTLGWFGPACDNVVAVSFDRPGSPYVEQIERAQQELAPHGHLAPLMLLKPERIRGVHRFAELEAQVERLRFFSAVGVTEHELGGPLQARVEGVIELREMLSRHSMQLPIHIFGALDPLFVPLYFAAGADIFDGLTWLRYGFDHGLAVHRESAALLSGLLEERDDVRSRTVQTSNLGELSALTRRLQRFAVEGQDWSLFDHPDVRARSRSLGETLENVFLSAKAGRS